MGQRHGLALLLLRRGTPTVRTSRWPTAVPKFVSWVGAEPQRAVVRAAFKAWEDLGIGLEFVEVERQVGGRDPDRFHVRLRRLVVVRRTRHPQAGRQCPDDELRLGPDPQLLRHDHRGARDRPHDRDAARTPEPVRRHRVGRAGRLLVLRWTAQQLAAVDHLPQRAAQAEHR